MNRWRPHILSDGCSYISADTYAWGDSVRWWTSLLKINHSSVSVQYKNNHFALMRPKRARTTSCGEAVYSEITESICVRVVTKTNCKVNWLQDCISIILRFAFQYLFYNHTLHLLCLLYYKVQVIFCVLFLNWIPDKSTMEVYLVQVNVRSWREAATARGSATRTCGKPCQRVLAKQMLIHGLSVHVSRGGRFVELADFARVSCYQVILLPSL